MLIQKSVDDTAYFSLRLQQNGDLEVLIANGANIKIKCDKGISIKQYAEKLQNALMP